MGFHVCEYCEQETSSGDVVLEFENGHVWEMPDMILHYIADHNYVPPDDFIHDIMMVAIVKSTTQQTKSMPKRVGYLSGKYNYGPVPRGFFEFLWSLMNKARKSGQRYQTRGL